MNKEEGIEKLILGQQLSSSSTEGEHKQNSNYLPAGLTHPFEVIL